MLTTKFPGNHLEASNLNNHLKFCRNSAQACSSFKVPSQHSTPRLERMLLEQLRKRLRKAKFSRICVTKPLKYNSIWISGRVTVILPRSKSLYSILLPTPTWFALNFTQHWLHWLEGCLHFSPWFRELSSPHLLKILEVDWGDGSSGRALA
jgi:hypothetical protein